MHDTVHSNARATYAYDSTRTTFCNTFHRVFHPDESDDHENSQRIGTLVKDIDAERATTVTTRFA